MTEKDRQDILDFYHECRHDPYRFVLFEFPWGRGPLAGHLGPRKWQRRFLIRLGELLQSRQISTWMAIQMAMASGHGVGKSALVAWVILWAMKTFEDTRGIVTANTDTQLRTKTWPEVAKWHAMSLTKDWFRLEATSIHAIEKEHEKTWRIDMIPWSEHNTEAFSGLHNQGKRIALIFDEASAIADKIWEVAEGALTDEKTEIMWLVFGNPTRNTGRFRECFGRLKHIWENFHVDSREVEGTNKYQLQQMVDTYGEDSDIVRVRVRGLFPRASSLQLISNELVFEAQKREAVCMQADPLIMTLDMARGGDDNCVFRFRRGMDARTIPPVKIPGSESRDSMKIVSKALHLISTHKPDAIFVDATGIGGPVADRLRQLGNNVFDVQFGAASPDPKCLNLRAYMYVKAEQWLRSGGAIDDDATLATDLTSIEFDHNQKDQLRLESKEHMKERGLSSPDDGDAFAMSFAYPVSLVGEYAPKGYRKFQAEWYPDA